MLAIAAESAAAARGAAPTWHNTILVVP